MTRYNGSFFSTWKVVVSPLTKFGVSFLKRIKHDLMRVYNTLAKNLSFRFSFLWNWLFQMFPERTIKNRLISSRFLNPPNLSRFLFASTDGQISRRAVLFYSAKAFVNRSVVGRQYDYNMFYGRGLEHLSDHIYSGPYITGALLCSIVGGVMHKNSSLGQAFRGVLSSWALASLRKSVRRVPSFLGRLSSGFLRALRKRKADLSFGAARRRMRDFRNFILRLDYSNLRIAFGDYEEGFRIPAVPGDHYKKSKKQYRLLEKFRLETFYGIFDLPLFLDKYHAMFSTDTGSSSSKVFQLMECRMIFLLHRTNVFPSMYYLDQLITHGNASFEGFGMRDPHVIVGLGRKLYVPFSHYWFSINVYLRKTYVFRLLLNAPAYLEMNYVLLSLSPIMRPLRHQLTHPFSPSSAQYDPSNVVRSFLR